MKKVVVVDVAGSEYIQQLFEALKIYCDVTLITKYYSNIKECYSCFYKHFSKMKKNRLYYLLRGCQYIIGWIKATVYILKKQPDVVHVQWALVSTVDRFFWHVIKMNNIKLIYTAHDVIPHNNDKKIIERNAMLYQVPDRLIVHGQFCKNEVKLFYPEYDKKTYIQYHGVYKKQHTKVRIEVNEKHKRAIEITENKKCVFAFLGQINGYKGLDLLKEAWEPLKNNSDICLLIFGKTIEEFRNEFEPLKKEFKLFSNVYLYNDWFNEEEEELALRLTDLVVLPYKTASMSGILFSAAKHNKTLLTTNVGCIPEYLEKAEGLYYKCDATSNSLRTSLLHILEESCAKEDLINKGNRLSDVLYKNFSWNEIAQNLVEECY